MGDTLDKRRSLRSQRQNPENMEMQGEPVLRRDPGSRVEGNAKSRKNPDSR